MDNLSGFVKMAIISNPNLDNKAVEILCKYVDDLENSVIVLENQYGVQSAKNQQLEQALYKKCGEITDLHTRINTLEHLLELAREAN